VEKTQCAVTDVGTRSTDGGRSRKICEEVRVENDAWVKARTTIGYRRPLNFPVQRQLASCGRQEEQAWRDEFGICLT
jgi:hypothetical protein